MRMLESKAVLDSIPEATSEIEQRKREMPDMIHTVEMHQGFFIVSSREIEQYFEYVNMRLHETPPYYIY